MWYQTAHAFLATGYPVSFAVSRQMNSEKVKELSQSGAHHFTLPRIGFTQRLLEKHFNQSRPKTLLRKEKPALVLISLSSYEAGQDWMEACLSLGIPYVNLFQIVSAEFRFGHSEKIERARNLITAARGNFFVSKQNQLQLEAHLACILTNALVVWNPFKGNLDSPFSYPEATDTYRLAVVASYTPGNKGQDVLLKVLADKKWKDRNLVVSLFGKGKYEAYLRKLAMWYGLRNVHFGGHQSIHEIWQSHQGLLLPSRKEGMSLALIEAMIIGRFGITTNVGGAHEVITDNVTGFIAEALTPALLDDALERAWQQRSQWPAISKKAYESIRTVVPTDPARFLMERIIALMS